MISPTHSHFQLVSEAQGILDILNVSLSSISWALGLIPKDSLKLLPHAPSHTIL